MHFEMDVVAVQDCAAAISDLGTQVVAGAARAPATEAVPRWATADATSLLLTGWDRRLRALGGDVVEAAGQIVAAVADYQDADDRAARRLRSVW